VVGRLERAILRVDFIVPVKIEFPEFGRRSVVHRLWRVKIEFPEFGRRSVVHRLWRVKIEFPEFGRRSLYRRGGGRSRSLLVPELLGAPAFGANHFQGAE
jgi:hypothetical protein